MLKACKALWWKEDIRLGEVTFMERCGEPHPFLHKTDNQHTGTGAGKGVVLALLSKPVKSAASEMIWERFSVAGEVLRPLYKWVMDPPAGTANFI